MIKKGIILAGGMGSRVGPSTKAISKQLLPIADKPIIFYSLSILMLLDIKDILIIVKPSDRNSYKKLLGNGKSFGIKITYINQNKPRGLPDAFILGKKFIANKSVALILGDNFFHGQSLIELLKNASKNFKSGANIFSYNVKNPQDYGVIENSNKGIKILEKPRKTKSKKAITGLYFFDKNAYKFSNRLKYSKRGELEIVDLINIYIKKSSVKFEEIGRGISWLDMGSFEDLNDCSNYIRAIEKRQNFMISSPEEIAFLNNWITKKKLLQISNKYNNDYGDYLKKLCL